MLINHAPEGNNDRPHKIVPHLLRHEAKLGQYIRARDLVDGST